MDWGGRFDGEVYGRPGDAPWDFETWNLAEAHMQKRASSIHYGQPLGVFDTAAAEHARSRGATPMVDYGIGNYTLTDIAAGRADADIDAMTQKIASFGSIVRLRPWWEMNGGWFGWGRNDDFVPAWRNLVTRVRAGAPNARFVWCVNTVWDEPSGELHRWYPGGAYVDWVGVDGYNFNRPWHWPNEVFDPTLKKLAVLNSQAPWAICETACTEEGGDKAAWITKLLTKWLPNHKRVKLFHWFNWNIFETGDKRRDWPVESSPRAQAAFARGIQLPRYASPT